MPSQIPLSQQAFQSLSDEAGITWNRATDVVTNKKWKVLAHQMTTPYLSLPLQLELEASIPQKNMDKI